MVLRFLTVINRPNSSPERAESVATIYGKKLLKEEIVIVFPCLAVLIENENTRNKVTTVTLVYIHPFSLRISDKTILDFALFSL